MTKKVQSKEIKRQNRTVTDIHYYADDGREIAFYTDDGKGEAYSKVLYFNGAMMAVQCYELKGKSMTYVERAKPQYMEDFAEVAALHPGIPQSEYVNA